MSGWEWIGFAGTLASILGLFSWLGDRRARLDRHAIHTATQQTLTDLHKGMTEGQQAMTQGHQALAAGQQAMAQAVIHLGDILERMDQRADERHREVMSRRTPGGGG